MKHIKKIHLIYSFFIISIFIVGCHKDSVPDIANTREVFNQFTKELFLQEVQSDSISLNYTLSDPSNYGINNYIPSLGAFGLDAMKEDLANSENYLVRLDSISYELLTEEQQLTYDIIDYTLTQDTSLDNLLLYPESLSPMLGIQAQLPVLFAEYTFHDKDDIDHYIGILSCTYDYFHKILTFEQEKSKAGLFMSDFAVEDIINQCSSFIKEKESNLLITVFNDKVATIPGLTKKEIKTYQVANREAVLKNVIPAYELLINGLNNLKGTGVNDGGLCNFPEGKAYYEYLVKNSTGSSKSIHDISKMLDDTMNSNITQIQQIAITNPDALNAMQRANYKLTDPNQILEYLEEAIKADYPPLLEVDYTIKYVDESLEDYLSPAFYLTPALDNYQENSIYINRSSQFDLSTIFTTLAHEGYPGHLYQCVYFNEQSPDPIRSLLNFGGYSEGWATYVELESYYLAGFDKDVATLFEKNNSAILALYARVDIGVNYEGWNYEDTSLYLKKQINLTEDETILNFYHSVIEDPGNYLKYTIGYLELLELRNKTQAALNEDFNLKDFHEFILKIGPAPFHIIDNRLDAFIASKS